MDTQVNPLTWRQTIAYALVAIVSAIVSPIVIAFFNRGKSKAEIRNLDAQSASTAGDLFLKALRRLDDAETNKIEIRGELEDWKRKAGDLSVLRAANTLLEEQLKAANIQAKYWEGEAKKVR